MSSILRHRVRAWMVVAVAIASTLTIHLPKAFSIPFQPPDPSVPADSSSPSAKWDIATKKKKLQEIKVRLQEAAKRFKAEDFDGAAELVNRSTADLPSIIEDADARLLKQIDPIVERLTRAHQLLSIEGVELDPLPKLGQPTMEPTDATSDDRIVFTRDIAPWMIQQCGRCHVQGKRGGFGMATFADLMKGSTAGVVLFPGDAKASRLVEVIETGDMPRGGAKVSPENLQKLKDWIDQGAVFDGADANAAIGNQVPGAPPATAMEVARPTGKETVSFVKDIAPILMENCNGCHYDANRVRGGLRMDNFAQLLKGGDSGAMINLAKPDESLLIKKLRGQSGQRMPAGRPALSDDRIRQIETWMSEGAAFDGSSPEANLGQAVQQAWAASATAEELRQRRAAEARKLWSVVMPKAKLQEIANDSEFILLGSVSQDRLEKGLKASHAAAKIVRKQLRIPEKDPILKGGVVIFVFDKRYDYSEFGKMAESRTLPAEWTGHWRKQTVDAYISLYDDAEHPDQLTNQLIQLIAGVHVGSADGVPAWFAEGVGRNTLAVSGSKDHRVKSWFERMPSVATQVKDGKQLIEGKLGEEEAALVGFALVQDMGGKANRKQFDGLLRALRNGDSFDAAIRRSFGAPFEAFLDAWLGKR